MPRRSPFDDARVRRALSLAIDRWTMADTLSNTTYLKFVGGIMRPGFAMATPEAELATLPGLAHDGAALRAEARRLLTEAKVPNLSFALVNREIGVNATEKPSQPQNEGALEDQHQAYNSRT